MINTQNNESLKRKFDEITSQLWNQSIQLKRQQKRIEILNSEINELKNKKPNLECISSSDNEKEVSEYKESGSEYEESGSEYEESDSEYEESDSEYEENYPQFNTAGKTHPKRKRKEPERFENRDTSMDRGSGRKGEKNRLQFDQYERTSIKKRKRNEENEEYISDDGFVVIDVSEN